MSDGPTDEFPPKVAPGTSSSNGREPSRSGSDSEIDVKAFMRGDPVAFGAILVRFGPLLRRITDSYARSGDEEEDLYQEVCIRIWQQRECYEEEGKMEGWLATLAHRRCRNWHDQRNRRAAAEERYAAHVIPIQHAGDLLRDPSRLLNHRRFLRTLREVLADLPARQVEAFRLVRIEKMKPKEVARLMGVKPVTIRSHVRHARKKLRRRLKDAKDDLS